MNLEKAIRYDLYTVILLAVDLGISAGLFAGDPGVIWGVIGAGALCLGIAPKVARFWARRIKRMK